jgi:pyrroloquinoline quinone (PQQ) biosynthesis protein C
MSTDLMVSYAYDTVARKNPVGFFGMVYVLEKTSSTIATAAAESIQTSLKLPKKAMSYMISHGSLDVSHMQEYEVLMNQLSDESDKQAVIDTAIVMYSLYGNIFRALEDLANQPSDQLRNAA